MPRVLLSLRRSDPSLKLKVFRCFGSLGWSAMLSSFFAFAFLCFFLNLLAAFVGWSIIRFVRWNFAYSHLNCQPTRVDEQCRRAVRTASVDERCGQSVGTNSGDGQCRRAVWTRCPDSQCGRTVGMGSVDDKCGQSVRTGSADGQCG